jgi:hypothetical protein
MGYCGYFFLLLLVFIWLWILNPIDIFWNNKVSSSGKMGFLYNCGYSSALLPINFLHGTISKIISTDGRRRALLLPKILWDRGGQDLVNMTRSAVSIRIFFTQALFLWKSIFPRSFVRRPCLSNLKWWYTAFIHDSWTRMIEDHVWAIHHWYY